jgi:hypothetical protein
MSWLSIQTSAQTDRETTAMNARVWTVSEDRHAISAIKLTVVSFFTTVAE